MGFIQIVEFRTDKIDEMRALDHEWAERGKTEGATARRGILCADLDDPGRYLQIVFFDSAESAEENSTLPLTNEMAAKMMAVASGEPRFHNLDVVEDRDYG